MTQETFSFYIQPWYRKSPYFEATKRAGCKSWGLYNHMLLPTLYDDPVTEYWALLRDVTVWDVAACRVGQCRYVLLISRHGGLVNDPVLLYLDDDRVWLALADSDAALYAKGVAAFT